MSIETVRRICLCLVLTALCVGGLASGAAQALPHAPAAPLPTSGWIPPTTTRVSVASDGEQGDYDSDGSAISADGRYVAFTSQASNLVAGDTNNVADIFVHDRETGETTRVSVASNGEQANDLSSTPAISANGRYVAFSSYATNLVPFDTNGYMDVFVHDRQTGETTRVSVASNGEQGDAWSTIPAISADGRYVAFHSAARNLTPIYLYGVLVYVHDRETGQTTHVSTNSNGEKPNGSCEFASISADGRYVAFASGASNLVPGDTNESPDVFVHDRWTRQTTRVSISSGGMQGNSMSWQAAISADGRYVTFRSWASNLVAGDTNGLDDILVHDRQTGETTRVSVASDGEQANQFSYTPAISTDGRYVTFGSEANNLAPGDTNGRSDIFVHDRQTGQTARVSIASDGGQAGDGASVYPAISADGRCVTFSSAASTLVVSDTNLAYDVFVHDRGGGIVLVRDEDHMPLPDAQVFHNHHLVGVTGPSGALVVPALQVGDHLVARYQVREAASAKAYHNQDADQNWAYRVYITSLDIPRVGEPTPFTVADPTVDQVLTVTRTNTLIGFNILASVEWDADAAYLSQLRQGFELASTYLYDASDGQMLFERVSIFDNAQHWADADFQVHTSNQEWPRANVAAILNGKNNYYVYLGRYFDGSSASQGPWTRPNGYRTLIHEFGHYGLGLWDSYYYTATVPPTGTVKLAGHCTLPAIRNNTTPDINATLMYYQFNATEFAMQGISGLWAAQCRNTHQWQMHNKSDWETIVNYYMDQATPHRWWMKTPASHGGVVAGPTAIPVNAWTWTEVGNSARAPICNVAPVIQAIQGATVVPMATVTLHRSGTGQIIAQGKTDANGRATILGAGPGARVNFTRATAAGPVSGDVIINCAAGHNAHSANEALQVVLTPDPFTLALSAWPGSDVDALNIEVAASVSLSEMPQLLLQQRGSVTPTAVALHYDAGRQVYTATAILTTSPPMQGVLVAHAVNTDTESVAALLPFNITAVEHDQHSTLWSGDGLAELYLPPGALAADGRVSIVAAPLRQPLPEGLVLIGGPYAIGAAPGLSFSGSGNLTLHYPAHGDWETRVQLFGAAVHWWDGAAWQALSSTFDTAHHYAAAPVNAFGLYAILTAAEPISGIYLPLVLRE